ncbi:hypothetical protein fugu_009904 [Takifugu bimaculatus]|uniref:C2H2-type domain-containing protein n=1 Tax=Takifugu bimaculatus TaxID=433685 RepID=A0A4Z2CDV1_9TELE|nr:hypothetical protein fugu_009904 [Takifugu bimaculatus]
MMLGFQGTSSASKTYRCPACSATFTGLASLLVHQASHASAMPKVPAPAQPNAGLHDTLLSNTEPSSEQPPANPPHLPESPPSSFFICDCGEEFHDFNLMLEHKRSHVSKGDLMQSLGDDSSAFGTRSEFGPAASQASESVLSPPSTSRPPAVELPTVAGEKPDVSLEDGVTMETTAQEQHTSPRGVTEKQLENAPAATEKPPESAADEDNNSGPSTEKRGNLPSKNYVMKLVASAYMKQFTPPPYDAQDDEVQNDDVHDGIAPDDVSLQTKPEAAPPINDLSIAQLRRLLSKPDIKTKAPSISRVLESSKKKVVSLTKILSPVVVLETRQKLKDPSGSCTFGSYQCGRCRRLFENLDRLTEHHFLHKKERIKCCRRCKQLIIGRMPLPDKHICPQLGNKAIKLSKSFRNRVQFSQKLVPFHSLSNTRKVFFCPLCKHSYARRWNLKNHKCHGSGSSLPLHVSSSFQNVLVGSSFGNEKNHADGLTNSQMSKSVGVGPEVTSDIKLESASPRVNLSPPSQSVWNKTGFSSLYPKSHLLEKHEDVPLSEESVLMGEESSSSSWDALQVHNEDGKEGQWTMPLDDETEMHSSLGKTANGIELSQENEETASSKLSYFIKEGVKRYPCNGCQKTYSRASTLSRHLRLCGFWPRGVVTLSGGQGAPLSNRNPKPTFSCYVCGRNFNRKDNMMTHRARCQLKHSVTNVDATTQPHTSGNPADGPTQENDGANWGIMSLPSVLPRRVTCECGVGFTSPRLLLEHLQKHAQESYTCPTCGETVGSWADYEVHLHIHMHPHHQLLKGLQPQRSHPLLIRFQQQPQQQPPQSAHQPPPDRTSKAELPSNPVKKQQRAACTRCGNTFATRCSLRRHLSWNRCKGLRMTNPSTNPPKTYHCSHCNSNFPNATSLLFHQRSGACKPAIKPVRCPVCLRWFGTVDGLQKHLLTHKQS